jgi:SAM-dependent methyltransferase
MHREIGRARGHRLRPPARPRMLLPRRRPPRPPAAAPALPAQRRHRSPCRIQQAAAPLHTYQPRRPPPPQDFSWPGLPRTLRLSEAAGTAPGFGHKIWPSAHALVAHLVARDDLTGMRVVELGCGVGLTGLAAAALGARVVLTDRDSHVLAQAAANIDLNKPALLEAGGRVATFKLDWRDSAALQMLLREHGPFDLIVASDVLYSASLFPSLLHTIDALSSSSVGPAADAVTLTLIACPERDNRSHAKGGDYFAAMANGERAGKAALVRTHAMASIKLCLATVLPVGLFLN